MFEKEAKECFKKRYPNNIALNSYYVEGFNDGYNKANEWHCVKDGLPSEDGRYLVCNIFSNNYVATNIAEFNSKNGIFGCIENSTIYAWKEIVLPELPKEIK